MYVAEVGNKRVQVLAANGDYIRHWGSEGTGPGQFRAARGVAVDGDGDVWTVEGRDARVQKFTSQGAYLYEFRDGRRGRFGALAGIEVDGLDRVLIPDGLPGFARIQIYTNDGTPIIDMNPPAPPNNTLEFLKAPVDMALAPGGEYYILDENVVRRYSPNWEFVGAFGGTLAAPQAIAISSNGDVFIADTGNNMVQKFNADGFIIKAWGTTGAGDGQFDALSGIAVSGSLVYVADTNNSRIQVFDLDGVYVAQWGSPGTGAGQFDRPIGITADDDGYLYVVDHGNGRIQKFDGEGQFIAAWGSPGAAVGQLNAPWGIAVDERGYVYVTEVGGYRVQAFRPVD
jgi:DNA-binding beta-propeller fold protein YncE